MTGNRSLPVPGGSNPPLTVFLQVLAQNGAIVEFSNAIEMTLGT